MNPPDGSGAPQLANQKKLGNLLENFVYNTIGLALLTIQNAVMLAGGEVTLWAYVSIRHALSINALSSDIESGLLAILDAGMMIATITNIFRHALGTKLSGLVLS